MKPTVTVKAYISTEEVFNIASHGAGFMLAIFALIALVDRGIQTGSPLLIVSNAVFGSSLIITYGMSTLYHSIQTQPLRNRVRVIDHACIYILIAGTYTPFTLVTLDGAIGWTIFGISWGMAVIGITLKLFFTGQFNRLSTLTYVLMGWIIIIAINPMVERLPVAGLWWLLAGGISYTVGALFYGLERIPFNHTIFHFFTLLGSTCHFMTIYFYVS